jgi:hypothetical protein
MSKPQVAAARARELLVTSADKSVNRAPAGA